MAVNCVALVSILIVFNIVHSIPQIDFLRHKLNIANNVNINGEDAGTPQKKFPCYPGSPAAKCNRGDPYHDQRVPPTRTKVPSQTSANGWGYYLYPHGVSVAGGTVHKPGQMAQPQQQKSALSNVNGGGIYPSSGGYILHPGQIDKLQQKQQKSSMPQSNWNGTYPSDGYIIYPDQIPQYQQERHLIHEEEEDEEEDDEEEDYEEEEDEEQQQQQQQQQKQKSSMSHSKWDEIYPLGGKIKKQFIKSVLSEKLSTIEDFNAARPNCNINEILMKLYFIGVLTVHPDNLINIPLGNIESYRG